MVDTVSAGATASYLQLVVPAPSTSDTTKDAARVKTGDASARSQGVTRVHVDRSESGVYVYRLVDAATGRVLAELPRADSDRLKVMQDDLSAVAALA